MYQYKISTNFLLYYRYSILPYWKPENEDALALLEREMARAEAAGEDMALDDESDNDNDQGPYIDNTDMEDSVDDSNPGAVDYIEGAELADKQKPLLSNSASKVLQEETVPSNIIYSQPHSIRKNPAELAKGQIDNFENPYRRATPNVVRPQHGNSYSTGKVFY